MNGARGSFVGLTLRRPVTVLMILFACILVGAISTHDIPVELVPSGFVDTSITVSIPVPDANPQEVEEQVTRPTEEILRQIAGKDEIVTRSSKNRSSITITFSQGVDPDEAFAEVRDLMEVAKLSWPEGVQEYFTFRFNLETDLPVFAFGVMFDEWNEDTAFLIDEKIKKRIESVDGVARVEIWGVVDDSIRIFVDREKAAASNVSLFEVAQAIGSDGRDVVGGEIDDGQQHFFLRSLGRFRSIEELEDYPIRPDLRLRDVATVTAAGSYRNFVFRLENKRSIWCQVTKESGANTVDVCRRVKRHLEDEIMTDPRLADAGWTWFTPQLRDFGYVISSALENLIRSALLGGLLALIPLLLFLRRVSLTVIITTAIPISLLVTIGWHYFTGGTLNVFSMLGITIAVGMLVDNSIVVVENIDRHRRMGVGAREAALTGTGEVALAVTVATLTTVAAFLPLIFMSDDSNVTWMTKGIGLPVCYAVLASLFVALVFIPLATVFLSREKPLVAAREAASRGTARLAAILSAPSRLVVGAYSATLKAALANRFVAICILLLLANLLAAPMREMAQAGMVDDSGGHVGIDVELENNFTLPDANRVFVELFEYIDARRDELGVDYVFYWHNRRRGALSVGLLDRSARNTKHVVAELSDHLPQPPGTKVRIRVESQQSGDKGVKVSVYGPELDELAEVSEEVASRLEALPDVQAIRSTLSGTDEEIVVAPDRQRMQMFGVDPRVLMGTVQYGIRGQRLPDFHQGDHRMPMFIEFDDADATSAADLRDLEVWTRSGKRLPLSNFADILRTKGYGTIRKVDGRASVDLTVETLSDDEAAVKKHVQEALADFVPPPGYSFRETGTLEQEQDYREVIRTVLLACVLVALLMGILFEHVLLPLAVLVSIPFAWLGAFFTLWATDTPRDMVSMIGLIVLVGIVVNNGIVLLDCAHRLIRRGLGRQAALLEAGRLRLRPILMTTGTTVVGLLPMALTTDTGSFVSYKALARGVAGGLLISTVCTLIAVPIVYSLIDDAWSAVWGAAKRLVLRPAPSHGDGRGTATR